MTNMINRRKFLGRSALAVGAGVLAGQGVENLFAFPYGKPAGLQIYTVREQLSKDVPGTIRAVAKIGYKEVEPFEYYGRTAAQFRKLLDDNGLRAPSGHVVLRDVRAGWQKHIDFAKEVGHDYIVIAFLFPSERRTLDDYKRVVETMNKAGEQSQKSGLQLCYHNHNFEFQKVGDTVPFDMFLAQLDPKLVKIEMDCFWVTHAGQDPVAYLEKYPARFPLLHIKDVKKGVAPSTKLEGPKDMFTEVGRGSIDWERVFRAAKQGGLEHYYVEQDECPGSPLDSIRISFDYLKNLQV